MSEARVEEFLKRIVGGCDVSGESATMEIRNTDWEDEVSMIISIDRGLAKTLVEFSKAIMNEETSHTIPAPAIPGADVILGRPFMFTCLRNGGFKKTDERIGEILEMLRTDKDTVIFNDTPKLSHGIGIVHGSIEVEGKVIRFRVDPIGRKDDCFEDRIHMVSFHPEEFLQKIEQVFAESPAARIHSDTAKAEDFLDKIGRGENNTGETAVAEIRGDDWPEGVSMVISLDRGLAQDLADFSEFLAKSNAVKGSVGIPGSDIVLRAPYPFMVEHLPGADVFLGKPFMFSALDENFRKADEDTEKVLDWLRKQDAEAGYRGKENPGDTSIDRRISISVDSEGISFKPYLLSARQDDAFFGSPCELKIGREEFREKMENAFSESPAPRM